MTSKIFKGDDCVIARILLDMLYKPDTTQVTTRSNHGEIADSELTWSIIFPLQIDFESIIDFDFGVWIADSPAVMGSDEWNTSRSSLSGLDLAEFEAWFLGIDSMKSESSLGVVQEANCSLVLPIVTTSVKVITSEKEILSNP